MRESSSSITQLVKIVAREVVEEYMKGRPTIEEYGEKYLNNITSSLEKAGRPWTLEEDSLLVQEVRTAVAQIAKNHGRSIIAITSRIDQKELC